MEQKKLIACDVDGTLIRDSGDFLEDSLFEVIRELYAYGFIFVPVSGRDYSGISKLFGPVHDRLYYISTNGAQIRAQDEIIYEDAMDLSLIQEIIVDVENKSDYPFFISASEDTFIHVKDKDFAPIVSDYSSDIRFLESWEELKDLDTSLLKLACYCDDGALAGHAKFAGQWEKRLHLVVSGDKWLDFSLADKGTGLTHLAELLDIKQENTWAFGDQYNDLPMLEIVQHPYIMSHAYEDLTQRGFNLADSVEEELRKLINIYQEQ